MRTIHDILLILMLASILGAQISKAAINDQPAGTAGVNYVNIEFSHDGKHAVLFEGVKTNGVLKYEAFLSQIDTGNGQLVPASGKQHSLGFASMVGMPQFGQDSLGSYVVFLNESLNIVFARPNGAAVPKVITFNDRTAPALKLRRMFPYPSRNGGSALQYVTYQIRDEHSGEYTQKLVELTNNPENPANHIDVYKEKPARNSSPAIVVNFSRWIPGTFTFTHGAYQQGCTGNYLQCPSQLKQVTVSGNTFRSEFVTNDQRHKVDGFPYKALDGNSAMVGGLDMGAEGGSYRYDATQRQYVLVSFIPYHKDQSDLVKAGAAQSFEPFTWKGEQYVAYQQVEMDWASAASAVASSYPGEIWVAKLGASPVSCRVSLREYAGDPTNLNKRARVDAEPIPYANGEGMALYYHSTLPTMKGDPMLPDLRRIDLGDKATFDAACSAGTAFMGCAPGNDFYNGACYEHQKACPIANGSGTQIFANGSYGACVASGCNSGFTLSGGACHQNVRACLVPQGWGVQVFANGGYGACWALSCTPRFEPVKGACAARR